VKFTTLAKNGNKIIKWLSQVREGNEEDSEFLTGEYWSFRDPYLERILINNA
jgi:hypothetical protein